MRASQATCPKRNWFVQRYTLSHELLLGVTEQHRTCSSFRSAGLVLWSCCFVTPNLSVQIVKHVKELSWAGYNIGKPSTLPMGYSFMYNPRALLEDSATFGRETSPQYACSQYREWLPGPTMPKHAPEFRIPPPTVKTHFCRLPPVA